MSKIIFESDFDEDKLKGQIGKDNLTLGEWWENEGKNELEKRYQAWESLNKKRNDFILKSQNPILIEWRNYYKKIKKEDDSFSRMANLTFAFQIFNIYIQFQQEKGKSKQFIETRQKGFSSEWDDFSKVFLGSPDFVETAFPNLDKRKYLKYEKLTYRYLENLHNGKNPPKFKYSEFLEQLIRSEDFKFISDTYFKFQGKVEENDARGFRPIFSPEIRHDVITDLGSLFSPAMEFENLVNGNPINGKIDFKGKQAKLAGIFYQLRKDNDIEVGTHEQTFEFIKDTFMINGKDISSKTILSYLNGKKNFDESNLYHA